MSSSSTQETMPWDGIVPEETLEHYRKSGFAGSKALGKKPALLIIDVQYATSGEVPLPLSEATSYHPMSCGEEAWRAISHIEVILKKFRECGFPVLYPHIFPQFRTKNARMPNKYSAKQLEIVREVAPQEGDILVPKTCPSAFFATPLVKYLNELGVDTVFTVGNTTSGCIRASVVDAASYAFDVFVPYEGCYDRSPISHAVNLFDIDKKYGPVVSTKRTLELLDQFSEKAS